MDVSNVSYGTTGYAPLPQSVSASSQGPTNEAASGNVVVKAAENNTNASNSANQAQETAQVKQLTTEAQQASQEHAKQAETNEYLQKTIEHVNKSLNTFNRELNISVHAKTNRIMVKVMDTSENKVIREIPPEKVLDAFAKTLELAGILVDKKR